MDSSRIWRDKNTNDDQNVDEASELQEVVKKTDEKKLMVQILVQGV
jgi:hypothetical protein